MANPPRMQSAHQQLKLPSHPAFFALALAQSLPVPVDFMLQIATVRMCGVFNQRDDLVDGFGVGLAQVARCRVRSYADKSGRDVVGYSLKK